MPLTRPLQLQFAASLCFQLLVLQLQLFLAFANHSTYLILFSPPLLFTSKALLHVPRLASMQALPLIEPWQHQTDPHYEG